MALLHLFLGFVDVDALHWMGKPESDWCLEPLRGMTRERGIALLVIASGRSEALPINSRRSFASRAIRPVQKPIGRRWTSRTASATGRPKPFAPSISDTRTTSRRCAIWTKRSGRKSLDPRDPRDGVGIGSSLGQLGTVAYERFKQAQEAGRPKRGLLAPLNAALDFYRKALASFPETAVDELAVTHHQLGVVYDKAGDLDRALPHYRKSIGYEEQQGDLYSAGQTRCNVAGALMVARRFADALAYAEAALANFQTYGDRAATDLAKTRRMIFFIRLNLLLQGGTP